jgi:hypothetical protein
MINVEGFKAPNRASKTHKISFNPSNLTLKQNPAWATFLLAAQVYSRYY